MKISNAEIKNYILSSIKLGLPEEDILKNIGPDHKKIYDIIKYKISLVTNEKIFVSLASYQDKETSYTIEEVFQKAENPENIRVACLYQGSEEDEELKDILKLKLVYGDKLLVGYVPKSETKGTCWARSKITEAIEDEDFFLQLDSHMIMVPHWDTRIKKNYYFAESHKTLLSIPPSPYKAEYTEHGRVASLYNPQSYKLFATDPFGFRFPSPFNASPVKINFNEAGYEEQVIQPFLVANTVFTTSKFLKEVPYDPFLYFNGEEFDLSIRAYTNGWDIYTSSDIMSWHIYAFDNTEKILHQREFAETAFNRNEIAGARLLYKIDYPNIKTVTLPEESLAQIEKFSLGKERTIKQFEDFAGIDLYNKKLKNSP